MNRATTPATPEVCIPPATIDSERARVASIDRERARGTSVVGTAATDRLARRVHALALVSAAALYLSSPWTAMLRRFPRSAGLADYVHVGAGALAVLAAIGFVALAARGGRWRLYFPWLSGRAALVARDLAGLCRGRLPASEGGGLTSALQGLTVLAFAAAAATGAGWLLANGGDAALALRTIHAATAHALGGLIVAHAVTALLHVVQMARG